MRRAQQLALAVVASLGATAITIGTPSAVADSPPVITQVDGKVPHPDFEGTPVTFSVSGRASTFKVDYTDVTPGTYQTKVICNPEAPQIATTDVPADAPNGVVTYPLTMPSASGATCTIQLFELSPNPTQFENYVNVLVLSPTFTTSRFKNSSGQAFYPRVAGHPDSWQAGFETNSPGVATMTLRNMAGKTVFSMTKQAARLNRGNNSRVWAINFAWDGHETGGALAPIGTYRVTFAAHSTVGTGSSVLGSFPATVKSGRRTITRSAYAYSVLAHTSKGGGCFAAPQQHGELWLDCSRSHGGPRAFASAYWKIAIPSSAKIISYKLLGGSIGSTKAGKITSSMTRPKRNLVKVSMRVTVKRSYFITKVRVTYSYLQ